MKAILSLILLFSVPAHGEEAQQYFSKILETNYLQPLRESGVEKIGNFPVRDFLSEAGKVKYVWNVNGFVTGSGVKRFCGMHTVIDHRVIANSGCWDHAAPEVKPIFSLHETLGALGYDDEDYQLSFMIEWFLLQRKLTQVGEAVPQDAICDIPVRKTKNEKIYLAGGSSVVGGGGSECELFIKKALFQGLGSEPKYLPYLLRVKVSCVAGLGETEAKKLDTPEPILTPYRQKWEKDHIEIQTSPFLGFNAFTKKQAWLPDFFVRKFREIADKQLNKKP